MEGGEENSVGGLEHSGRDRTNAHRAHQELDYDEEERGSMLSNTQGRRKRTYSKSSKKKENQGNLGVKCG